jgi:protein gp37
MNKTKIEWCDYTWNPVIGCKQGCFYCYARTWAKRAGRDFNNPAWSEGQYRKPYKIKEPSKIFVCSLADLFGDWIPREWIKNVLTVVKENRQHTFMFLTKNPKRYLEFEFPNNCMLGTTIDYVNQARLDYLKQKVAYRFISFEPLLSDMSSLDLSEIDLVIVGANSSKGAKPPKKEWIESIKHPNIFYKNNIKKYI